MNKVFSSFLRPYTEYSGRQKKSWMTFTIASLGLTVAYMLWRAQFGMASFDECFYMTVPYRLTQGSAFFVDEWHGSQLSGFLLYPLMRLFLLFSPNGEGMVLTFRYFYVVVSVSVCIYLYVRGCRICPPAALVAAVMIMIFAPYSIRALSYNSMGLLLVTAACVTTSTVDKHPNWDMALCGLLFAGAVLCCPYLIAVFLLYIVTVLFVGKKHSKINECANALSSKSFVCFCAGAGILFIVFCVFTLSRAGIKEIVESIPHILSDPEHGSSDFLYDVKRYAGAFFRSSDNAPYVIFACIALLAVLGIDKGRINHRAFYMVIAVVLTVVYVKGSFEDLNVNHLMFPLCIPGFFAFVLSSKKHWRLFIQIFIPGVLYSVCMHFTSNQWYLAICYALSVSSVASVFFVVQLAKELLDENDHNIIKNTVAALLIVLLVGQIGAEIYSSLKHVDYEPSVGELSCRVESGVQKGIVTTGDKAEKYCKVLNDTETVRESNGDYVLYFSDDVWLVLADKKPTAAYSAWLGFEMPHNTAQRIFGYWQIYPEKLPDMIYVKKEFYYGWKDSIFTDEIAARFAELGYEISDSETGFILKKLP